MTRLALFALSAAACASHPPAMSPAAQDPLVGSWRLIALEEPGADGALHRADCTGQLMFSSQGHVAVQVMYRTPQADTTYVVGGYEATFGTYRGDPASHTFTMHVDGALARPLLGKDLPRAYQLTGDQLVITSTNPAEHWRVTWQRGAVPGG